MKLIVGLGNPGREYEKSRHNAGFMAIGALASRHAPGGVVRSKFQSDTVDAMIGAEKCLLMAPMTYMNRSGGAVQEAIAFYKLDPAKDLLVMTDDLALPVGRIRLRASGSDGGHNGLGDITRALGSENFARLRIGIDEKPKHMIQADYVLSRFTDEDLDRLRAALDAAADAAETFVKEGIDAAMNRHNAGPVSGWQKREGEPGSPGTPAARDVRPASTDSAHADRAPKSEES